MGGIGSGRGLLWNKKPTLESTKRIDVRVLKKLGFLNGDCSGSLSWSRSGQSTRTVGVRMCKDRMHLSYTYR